MVKKIVCIIAAALLTAGMAVSAFASGSVAGKVTKVEGDKITVTVEGQVPSWATPGSNVSAAGGSPRVMAVSGNEVTLKFGKAKAATIKVDSSMKLTEASEDDLQGC